MSHLAVRNLLVLTHVDSYKHLSISPRTVSGSGCPLADNCLVTPDRLIYWTEVIVIYFKDKVIKWGKLIKLNIIYFIFHTCLKCKSC